MALRAVLLDIDGVLTVSWNAIPGAADAVGRLRQAGHAVAFVTNTTSVARSDIVERLGVAGIEADQEEIFTAPRAAATFVRENYPGARCYLVNSGSVQEDLEGLQLVDGQAGGPAGGPVEVVLTGGAGPEVGYLELNRAFRMLLDGAELVAMHRNLQWETAEGPRLDIGAFIAGLELASRRDAKVVGKPAPEFFAAILSQLGVEGSAAVMVGDDVEADVLGAEGAGIRGVLVRTGKFRPEVLEDIEGHDVDVIDSVSDLPDLLRAKP